MAFELIGDARHRDAALGVADGLARDLIQLRIDIDADVARRELEHHEPRQDADMRSGDAYARRVPHGLEQIVGKRAQIGVETQDGGRGQAQTRVGETQDWSDGHRDFLVLSLLGCLWGNAA